MVLSACKRVGLANLGEHAVVEDIEEAGVLRYQVKGNGCKWLFVGPAQDTAILNPGLVFDVKLPEQ